MPDESLRRTGVLLFATSYDKATQANHDIATVVREDHDVFLGGSSATRQNLENALRETTHPLFAMAHGEVDQLNADQGAPALRAGDEGVKELRGRTVFFFCCYTARELGKDIAAHGSRFWGFPIKIQAPDNSAALRPIFTRIFAFIKDAFADTDAAKFFQQLRKLCEEARDELDIMNDAPFAAYLCLMNIEQDLVLWKPGATLPQQPPHVDGKHASWFR